MDIFKLCFMLFFNIVYFVMSIWQCMDLVTQSNPFIIVAIEWELTWFKRFKMMLELTYRDVIINQRSPNKHLLRHRNWYKKSWYCPGTPNCWRWEVLKVGYVEEFYFNLFAALNYCIRCTISLGETWLNML